MKRFSVKRIAALLAAFALSGAATIAAIEPCDGIWVEPITSIYAATNGMPRLVAGAGFPITGRFALDARALVEWYPDADDGFFQMKVDGLARWYALGAKTRSVKSREGNLAGPYLALGVGLGYARLSGDDTVTILAAGPVAEAGARISIGALPVFVEPFIGYSLTAGPRFASDSGSGDSPRFGIARGANAGLRLGYSLR